MAAAHHGDLLAHLLGRDHQRRTGGEVIVQIVVNAAHSGGKGGIVRRGGKSL